MGSQSDRSSDKMPAGAVAKLILRLLICSVAVFVVTAVLNTVSLRDRPLFPLLIFLFLVSIVSSLWGFRYALFVSLLAALGFSWLRPPVGRFWLSDWRDTFALAAFLVIGITTSYLSDRSRIEALNAKRAEDAARRSEEGLREVIEDRKRAEEALRNSEERWRSVFENSAIGVALTDLNGRFLATNHVFQTMVGYTEAELRALNFLDVTHEYHREANWALITELLEGKRRQFQIEKKYRRKDGSLIWVSNNVSLVPGTERVPRFIMALSEDITQRKRAEEALQRSQAYLAEAQKLTHTGSWVWNVRTDALFWSQEVFRIYDYDPEKMAHPTWDFFERIHPEDRPKFEQRKKRLASAQKEWADSKIDFRIVLPDGTIKHLQSIAHPVIDSGDEIVGTVMDVTELKRTEEKLRRSEADLLEAQRISQTGSWKLDVSSGKVTVSPQIFRMFGVKPDEDTSTVDFWLSRNHVEDQTRIQEVFEKSLNQKTDYDADYRIVLPDGAVKYLHAVGHPVLNEAGDLG